MSILSKYIINNPKLDFVCGTVIKDGKILGGYNPEKFSESLISSHHLLSVL